MLRAGWEGSYEICQVHVAVGVQQHVVRLYIAMDDALAMDISESTTELSNPEPYSVFGERLSRNVES
jgi:hypothetical protein